MYKSNNWDVVIVLVISSFSFLSFSLLFPFAKSSIVFIAHNSIIIR